MPYLIAFEWHDYMQRLERSGSIVELQTLDCENPGSNTVLRWLKPEQLFSVYIAPVHSAVKMSTWL